MSELSSAAAIIEQDLDLEFVEPHITGGWATVHISCKDAVKRAKEMAKASGVTYTSDAEALRDFMVNHWAYPVLPTRNVRITYDKRGFSVWPAEVELANDGSEWFDAKCNIRGTIGMQDSASIERLVGRDMLCTAEHKGPKRPVILEVREVLCV